MWFDIETSKVRGKEPPLVIAVSTSLPQYRAMYSHGRESGSYLLRKLGGENVATLRSSALGSDVVVDSRGVATLKSCEVSLLGGRRSVLLLTGNSSPMEDQLQFASAVLEFAEGAGSRELYSIGTRWAEDPIPPDADPVPKGFSTDREGLARLRKCGVEILADEPAPFFASAIVGMAPAFGMTGYKISVDHGEPSPHPRGVASILRSLNALLGLEVLLDDLEPGRLGTPAARVGGSETIYH